MSATPSAARQINCDHCGVETITAPIDVNISTGGDQCVNHYCHTACLVASGIDLVESSNRSIVITASGDDIDAMLVLAGLR